MTQWRYKVRNYMNEPLSRVQDHMDTCGEDGWELVSFSDRTLVAVYKRPGQTIEEGVKEITRRLDSIEEILDASFSHELEARRRDRVYLDRDGKFLKAGD